MSKDTSKNIGDEYQSLAELLGTVDLKAMSPLPTTDYSWTTESGGVYSNDSKPAENLRNPFDDEMAADFLCD